MPTTSAYFSPLIAIIDFAIIVVSGYFAYWLRFSSTDMELPFQTLTGGMILLLLLSSTVSGVYQSWRGRSLPSLLKRYTLNLIAVIAMTAAFLVFTKSAQIFSRLWLGYFILFLWLGGISYRTLHYFILRKLRSAGKNLKRVLLITASNKSALTSFNSSLNNSGFEIVSSLPLAQAETSLESSRLSKEIKTHDINEVWLNLPFSMGRFIKDIIYSLRYETVDIRYLPDFEGIQVLNHKASNIAGLYTIDISCTPMDGFNRVIKRAADIVLATAIGLLITPACLVIALAIKYSSPGPVLFKQFRNGLNGKRVKVYKFRSMELHNEADGKVTPAQPGDPRITKLGKFLRRTSLDELPQFFNVLQGRMSIVGPRPHALEHNEYYKDLVESYMWRHKVKPGITGLAQIRGLRGLTDTVEKMEKRVECDLEYINNWSLWLDVKIILITTYKGFLSKNAF